MTFSQRLESASKKPWNCSLPARKVTQEPCRLQALASCFFPPPLSFIGACVADNQQRLYVIIRRLSPRGTLTRLIDGGVNGRWVKEKLMPRFSCPFLSRTEKIAPVLCLQSASHLPCKTYSLCLFPVSEMKNIPT